MKYFEALSLAMELLAKNKKSIFIGQSVKFPGTAMYNTLKNVNMKKRLELPVTEEMQLGITNGLAISGDIPVSIFPRYNFLLLAMNQLINHLDKFYFLSNGELKTKVIIRTSIGSSKPMNPQEQHLGDFTKPLKLMMKNIEIIRLDEAKQIIPAYNKALNRTDGKSTILVEFGDYYNSK